MAATVGRSHQKGESVIAEAIGWVVVIAVGALFGLVHLAVVATTSIQLTDIASTMRALVHPGQLPIWTWILVALAFVVLSFAAIVAWVLVDKRKTESGGLGFAKKKDIDAQLSMAAVRKTDARLWHGGGAKVPDRLFGFHVGWLVDGAIRKTAVVVGQEHHLMVLAPPGIGKTFRVVSRACMDAPGAVMVTSTRDDILTPILEARADVGPIYLFDPLALVTDPDPRVVRVRWDLLDGCQDLEVARARATRLVPEADNHADPNDSFFFVAQARDAISYMLMAAAMDGQTLTDVLYWGATLTTTDKPLRILRQNGVDPIVLAAFELIRNAPERTLKNIVQTISNATSALVVPKARASLSVMPVENGPTTTLDLADFMGGRGTLVIISDENDPTDVSTLTTMLVGEVFQAAKSRARRLDGERLSPPFRAVLDEVANIAPLPKLPALLSDSRGYGIQIVFVLQSEAQALETWGQYGARRLRDMADLLILGGIKDDTTLEGISHMLGAVDVREKSMQYAGGPTGGALGPRSSSSTITERAMLRPSEIREIPAGRGLLVSGTSRPVLVDLPGWTDVEPVEHPDWMHPKALPTPRRRPARPTVAESPAEQTVELPAIPSDPPPARPNPYLNLTARS